MPLIVPFETPPDRVNTTVLPPRVSWFPAASLVVSVKLTLLPAVADVAETVNSELESESAPGVTRNVGKVLDTLRPLMVAPSVVEVPVATPVRVAV